MNENSLENLFKNKANNLNLIRLLSAFAVIYGHASAVTGKGPSDIFLQLVGYKFIGGVAVDVFFVISGFLITASAVSGNGIKYYFASRILRIYPALIICVAISTFILGPAMTSATNYWTDSRTWDYFLWNSSAIKTEYFLPSVFGSLHDRAVNGSLWSIAVEVRLYIVIVILAIFNLISHRTAFNILFFSALTLSYLLPEFALVISPYENHRHVAMMFFFGAFAWVNRQDIQVSPVILLALLMFSASQHGTPGFGFSYSLLLAYSIFYLAFLPGLAWFNKVGDFSYGVYLYGWISQQITVYFFQILATLKIQYTPP
ncbi:MAG: acyltransferase [Hydrogenophaga sp.]|nr:acyltransferase [Hydrogenophaga sp.]